MSEVAADTPDGRWRRQQKLTARIPAKPWGGSLLKSTRAPQVTTPLYRGAVSAAAVRQGERHPNITRDPAVADDVERGVKSWIVHIDRLRVASWLPDLLCQLKKLAH